VREPKNNTFRRHWHGPRLAFRAAVIGVMISLFASASSHAASRITIDDGPSRNYLPRARSMLQQMTLRSDQIHILLRYARRARKQRASRCLDKMLNQAHAMERMGDSDFEALERAVEIRDDRTASQHLVRLERFDERSRFVRHEASSCGVRLTKRRVARR
jgi:hypothetical protein